MSSKLKDPEQRREFRRKLAREGVNQVRHLVASRGHYSEEKQAVAIQWLEDVESGAIVEDDLRDIADDLDALKPKYVNGGSMSGLFLRSEDEATALRLYTEAFALLDQRFGDGNQHTQQLKHTINNGSGGFASNGPSRACLNSTIELIRGFIRISERMPRAIRNSQITDVPSPGDFPLEQLPSHSALHLNGLSDEDLARYIAGWKPGTQYHILGTQELKRRELVNIEASHSAQLRLDQTFYVDSTRLDEIEALPSNQWDFSRLAQMCRELNAIYACDGFIATAAMVRIILDHVPPLFGVSEFAHVAANYGSPKAHRSFKKSVKRLHESMRDISDAQIHSQIRKTDALPNATQVDVRAELDVLLSEVVRIGKDA